MKRKAMIVLKSEDGVSTQLDVAHGFSRIFSDLVEFYTDETKEKMICVARMEHIVYIIFEDIPAHE